MSYLIIEDGTGSGNKAKVEDNKLQVESVSVPKVSDVSEYEGAAFVLATLDFVTLTNVQEHAVFYLKYTGDKKLHINKIRTCGTGVQKWLLYKGSTGGTIVSSGTSVGATNINLASSNILSTTAYRGADSLTQTGGTVFENWINNGGHSEEDLNGALILGKNDVIVLTCTNAATIDVCVRVQCYEHGDD